MATLRFTKFRLLATLGNEISGIEKMIWTLKIKLVFGLYAKDRWEGTLEIDSSSTLDELHGAIQDAVDFDNDHLYEFYVSRTARSRERIRYDDDNEEIFTRTIESIFPLEKDRKLFYMFDYGDSWLFQVSRSRKKPFSSEAGVKYPRLVNELGEKPEQYPVWEE